MPIDFLQNMIAAPIFEDEEQTRVARLLHILILGVLALTSVYALASLINTSARGLVYALAISFLSIVMDWIARRGYVRIASSGFTISLWLIFSIPWLYDSHHSIYASNYAVYMIPVLLAGFLLGGRASVLVATMNTVVGLLILLDSNRNIVIEGVSRPTFHWIALSISSYLAALLVKLATDNIRLALARAHEGERILAQRNRELQKEIDEHRQTEAALQLSQQRLRLALEVARLTIWDWDLQTSLLTSATNTSLDQDQRLQTMSIDQLIAMTHPEDRGILPNMLHRAVHENAPYEGEFRIMNNDQIQWFATAGRLFRDESGKPTHIIGVSSDVTERKQAEEERVDLAVTRQRVEMLTEFLSTMSHDFKTPISVINSSLYLIHRDPEKYREKLDSIQSASNLLDKYIQDILTILRLNYGPDLLPMPVNINDNLKAVCQRLEAAAEKKSIGLTLELDSALSSVRGDTAELDRLIVNLIENAINYTPHDGQILVRTHKQESGAVIEVSDTGIGISPEDCEHIFERFYRSSRARSSGLPGTGLGLAIVKRIVELHNAKIEVESTPDEGTTFRITFPTAP